MNKLSPELIKFLIDNEIVRVEAEFYGGGDSGSMEQLSICVLDKETKRPFHSAPKAALQLKQMPLYADDKIDGIFFDGTLYKAMEKIADDYIDSTHVDWYNDSGGRCNWELIIDPKLGMVTSNVSVDVFYTTEERMFHEVDEYKPFRGVYRPTTGD